MRSLAILLLVLSAFALSACSTTKKNKPVAGQPVKNPYTWQQTRLKPADIERVRTGEFVKTYHVGRSVSGRRGRILHEAHRAYRLEKPSRWNLKRHQPPLVSQGPVDRVVDSAFQPAPQSQAIRAELNRQKELSKELEQTSDAFTEAVVTAKEQLGKSEISAAVIAEMRNEIVRLRDENKALKNSKGTAREKEPASSESPADALRKWGEQVEESDSPDNAR